MVPPETLSISLSTFTLIALAEVGDKSQLVCMTLAARHRHWPVILGATTAFLVAMTEFPVAPTALLVATTACPETTTGRQVDSLGTALGQPWETLA